MSFRIGLFPHCDYGNFFSYLKGVGSNAIEWIDADPESWAKQNCDAYFLSQIQSDLILEEVHKQSSEVHTSGACDVMIKEGKGYWPHNLVGTVLPEEIIKRAPSLDTQAVAYVAGDGPWARTAIVSLIQMGFSKIKWFSLDHELAQRNLEKISDSFFKVDIRLLHMEDLSLQPSDGSVLVNTLSPVSCENEVASIAFLNFLNRNGLVVDMQIEQSENLLTNEAMGVGIRVLDGIDLAQAAWRLFSRKWLGDLELIPTREDIEKFLKTRPRPSKN